MLAVVGNAKQTVTRRVKIKKRVDYDYDIGDKILIIKDGILLKAESPKQKEPWTIAQVHTARSQVKGLTLRRH